MLYLVMHLFCPRFTYAVFSVATVLVLSYRGGGFSVCHYRGTPGSSKYCIITPAVDPLQTMQAE